MDVDGCVKIPILLLPAVFLRILCIRESSDSRSDSYFHLPWKQPWYALRSRETRVKSIISVCPPHRRLRTSPCGA